MLSIRLKHPFRIAFGGTLKVSDNSHKSWEFKSFQAQ